MAKTWKMITGLFLASAAMSLTACNNGGGGGGKSSSPHDTNGAVFSTGSRGYITPGVYAGVVSISPASMNTRQYAYFMDLLKMSVRSMNFEITVTTNGAVPGNAEMKIKPMHQTASYDGSAPGLWDTAETVANGTNGMILTYYSPDNSGQCIPGQNCTQIQPDIQIVSTVANQAQNNPTSCGGGMGLRQAMTVQLRVASVILGSGTLCLYGRGGGGGYPGGGYNGGGYAGGYPPGYNQGGYYGGGGGYQMYYRTGYYR